MEDDNSGDVSEAAAAWVELQWRPAQARRGVVSVTVTIILSLTISLITNNSQHSTDTYLTQKHSSVVVFKA